MPASIEPEALSIVVGSDGISNVTTSKETDTIVDVSSSDATVATGSFTGKTVTIHGVNAGTATITVGLSDGQSVAVVATVTAA